MSAVARKLREHGVLGLNERNADFIMRLNPLIFTALSSTRGKCGSSPKWCVI
jgi:hypothetical protein